MAKKKQTRTRKFTADVYMPLVMGDWKRQTSGLSPEAKNVFLNLLIHQWDFGFILLDEMSEIDHHATEHWEKLQTRFEEIGPGKFVSLWLDEVRAFFRKQKGNAKITKSVTPDVTPNATPKTRPNVTPHNESEFESDIDPVSDSDDELYGKCENFFHGHMPDDLIELAGRLQPMPNAGQWQDYVQKEIQKLGYTVNREVPCDYQDPKTGKMVRGRIDLEIDKPQENGFVLIGIELDYRQPRLKSIRKVETYRAGMVLLRDPKPVENSGKYDFKIDLSTKPLVSSTTLDGPTKAEIEEDIFNDFKLMDSFRKENPKINLKKVWGECWKWHSVKPSPPVHAWQWKQKLITFFNNENQRVKPPAAPIRDSAKDSQIDQLD